MIEVRTNELEGTEEVVITFEDDWQDWVWEDIEWSAEAEAEWQKLEELPDYEDVLEWQGKGWLWE